jgi:hypothetical protein
MTRMVLALFTFSLASCFLLSDFSRRSVIYHGEQVNLIVPRHYLKSEKILDSSGNEILYFYYPGDAVLYFAKMKDTSIALQYINYDMNQPRKLYHSIYFKGITEAGEYWRESRFANYKAGYYFVDDDRTGVFDSSINFFRLRSVGIQ